MWLQAAHLEDLCELVARRGAEGVAGESRRLAGLVVREPLRDKRDALVHQVLAAEVHLGLAPQLIDKLVEHRAGRRGELRLGAVRERRRRIRVAAVAASCSSRTGRLRLHVPHGSDRDGTRHTGQITSGALMWVLSNRPWGTGAQG